MRPTILSLQIGVCLGAVACASGTGEAPPPAGTPASTPAITTAKPAPALAGSPARPGLPGPWTSRALAGTKTDEKCTRFSATPAEWPVYRQAHRFDAYMHPTVRKLGGTFSLIDVDGDARPDIVTTLSGTSVFGAPGSFHWKVARNTGSGFAPEAPWAVPAIDLTRAWHSTHGYAVMDLDGDGKPDLVRARDPRTDEPTQWRTYGGDAAPHWLVYLGRGAGFVAEPAKWPVATSRLAGIQGALDGHIWTTMDLNGDKRPDILLTSRTNGQPIAGPRGPHWLVFLNKGNAFDEKPIEWLLPDVGYPDMFGRPSERQGKQGWTLMDLDRDGRPDLVQTIDRGAIADDQVFGLPAEPHWRVFANTGTGFSQRHTPWYLPHGYFTHTAKPLTQTSTTVVTWDTFDIGGGGSPDLVLATDPATVGAGPPGSPAARAYTDAEGPLWTAFLNTGNGFAFNHAAWRLPDPKYHRLWRYQIPDNAWDVADMNGDGCFDLIDTGKPHGANDAWHWKIYLGQ